MKLVVQIQMGYDIRPVMRLWRGNPDCESYSQQFPIGVHCWWKIEQSAVSGHITRLDAWSGIASVMFLMYYMPLHIRIYCIVFSAPYKVSPNYSCLNYFVQGRPF